MGTVPIFWRVTLPFLAGYFISYLYRSVNAIIGPVIARELGLSAAGLGLLTAIYFFAFAVFQLPLGLLLDRYGPRRVNATMLLVAAAGGIGFALGHSAAELTAARGLIGLGVSGCLMAAFSAFALWYPPERISTMNGVAFASGMLGAMVATVPLEMLLRVLHWREVFAGIVALNIAVSLLLFLVVPERTATQRGESVAAQLRSEGFSAAEKIRAEADRTRQIIIAEAYRDAQRVKGEGDAKSAAVYARAFSENPEFYSFYRSLDAYRSGFRNKSDVLVLDPNSEFFKYFRDPGKRGR